MRDSGGKGAGARLCAALRRAPAAWGQFLSSLGWVARPGAPAAQTGPRGLKGACVQPEAAGAEMMLASEL